MSVELLRALGLNKDFGQDIRNKGDWLSDELKRLGCTEHEINEALAQFAAQAGIARIMGFERYSPENVAVDIRRAIASKKSKRASTQGEIRW